MVEEFCRVCHETCVLYGLQYFTCADLSGDAFYRTCYANNELLMQGPVEPLTCGIVSSIFQKRYLEANIFIDNFDLMDWKHLEC